MSCLMLVIMLTGVYFDTACAIQLNCMSENPIFHISNFGGYPTTTVTLKNTTVVTVNCTINCTNVDLNHCSMEANAYVIVPSDIYSTYKVCPHNTADQFNRANYGVNVSCSIDPRVDICINKAEEVYTVTFSDFYHTQHKEFVIICGLTPSTIVVHRRDPALNPMLSLAINGLHERRGKAIIKIQDIQVYSDQIDHHPALDVKEGGNVTVVCTKTCGSTGVWKFVIKDQSNKLIEIEYSMDNHNNQLQARGINIKASYSNSSATMTGNDLQDFSITLTDIRESLTGMAIYCGAKEVNQDGTQLGQKFHSRAAVLVVHKEPVSIEGPESPDPSQLNAGEKAGISVGVIFFSMIIIVMIVLLSGGHIHTRNLRQRQVVPKEIATDQRSK